MELAKISLNPDNPRKITREKLDKLIGSILSFPKMLEARPIVVNDDLMALGGNMRHKALSAIAKMSEKKLLATLSEVRGYSEKTEEERAALADYWKEWKRYPTAPIIRASEFTEEEQREFRHQGQMSRTETGTSSCSKGWDALDLEEWGMDFTDLRLGGNTTG